MAIRYYSEDVAFQLKQKRLYSQWLKQIASDHDKVIGSINYIFCSDDYLLKINQDYLKHDYFTDIITFPYNYDPLDADIYISIDRIRENAKDLHTPYEEELRRVIAHGLLHMCGLTDKGPDDKAIMRNAEDQCLELWKKLNATDRPS